MPQIPAPGPAGPRRRLLRAALAAADRGRPVFPLTPYGKRPAVKAWPQVATLDPDQLTAWWHRAPYNIGIACGPAGLLDLDEPHPTRTAGYHRTTPAADHAGPAEGPPGAGRIDVPGEWAATTVRHGRDVLAHLARQTGQRDPRDTYTVLTPRGEQRYFAVPPTTTAPLGAGHDPDARERIRRSGRTTAGTLGWLIDINLAVGLSYGWWIDKHNRHHAHPNEVGSDPDIGTGALVFIPGERRKNPISRALTRAQAYFFFPLLLLEGLNLHVAGLLALRERLPAARWLEGALLALHVAGYAAVVFLVLSPLHGGGLHRRAAGRVRFLHALLVRPEPQGDADPAPGRGA